MTASVLAGSKCPSYRPFILLALLSALFSACAWSQMQLSSVFGIVTDSSGAAIPGAQVAILNQSTGLKRSTLPDGNGQYRLEGLPPGMHTIRAEKEKFQTEVLDGIVLSSGAAVVTDLSLKLGAVSQHVTVCADVAIDTTTSSVSGALAERSLTSLPLNSRICSKALSWNRELHQHLTALPRCCRMATVDKSPRCASELDERSHRRYGCK